MKVVDNENIADLSEEDNSAETQEKKSVVEKLKIYYNKGYGKAEKPGGTFYGSKKTGYIRRCAGCRRVIVRLRRQHLQKS